jgi:regulator of protease activity HflC (stomatin/prohibitin superfamily)
MAIEQSALIAIVVTVLIFYFFLWFLIVSSVRIVNHAEFMILERFGRYKMTLLPGIHFIFPIIERTRPITWSHHSRMIRDGKSPVVTTLTDRVDLREHVIEFGRQHVITKDTVMIDIDALVYFRVVDPRLAVYRCQNIPASVELVTQATLRNIIATMTLDDTFSSRDEINSELLMRVRKAHEKEKRYVTNTVS